MLWLFGQTWIWILIAFILGLVIGFLVAWLLRKKEVDVTEERVAAPAAARAAHSRDDDVDTVSSLGLAAGGAAAGGAAGLAVGSRDDADSDTDADADIKADADSDAEADASALEDGDRTEYIAAPGASADTDTDTDDVTSEAPALDEPEPTQVMTSPTADATAAGEAGSNSEQPALSMIGDRDEGLDAGDDAGSSALGFAGGAAAVSAAGSGSADSTTDASADATAAGTTDGEAGAESAGEVREGAYGPSSAVPLAGGAAPAAEFTVKGNEDSMLFHTTDSPYYRRTKAEVWFKTPADAEAAGFTAWNRPKAKATPQAAAAPAAPAVEAGAYPGSAKPLDGGAPPSPEYVVKGNEDSMLFHTTDSAFYDHTKAEVWFKTPAEAEAAGFTAWDKVGTSESTADGAVDDTRTPASGLPLAGGAGGTALSTANAEADTGRIPVQAATAAPATDGVAAAPAGGGVATDTATAPAESQYGANSALPLAGGAAPSADYTVKGNADSMLFHTADSPYYSRTVAEVWFKSAGDAEAAGFTAWNARRGGAQAAAAPAWEPGSYPGSAQPLADGSAPADEFTVKGNEDSMLFHTTESPYFPRTRAEVWFRTAADAESAGFTAWNRRR